MLITAMTVNGYNAEDLLIGTMISLLKDYKAYICDSNKDRGICLCSCINKLLEWCMLHRHGDKLYTSSLQFSFKSGHSTSMCSLALKDVVNYYRNKDPNFMLVLSMLQRPLIELDMTNCSRFYKI